MGGLTKITWMGLYSW